MFELLDDVGQVLCRADQITIAIAAEALAASSGENGSAHLDHPGDARTVPHWME